MRIRIILTVTALAIASAACQQNTNQTSATNATNTINSTAANEVEKNAANTIPPAQTFKVVERPQKIKDETASRGEQDAAQPKITVVEPKNNSTITGSTVKIKLELSGDLKGYKPMKDEMTGMGNHVHIILDNQPYEAYYNLGEEFELRNVVSGEHTLRFFPSRPWHESYKNDGAFQIVKFTVANGNDDPTKTTITNGGNTMAGNQNAATENKSLPASKAGNVDATKPLLTYSRPKGEYKDADAENIMVDFWLSNAKLIGDGGEHKVAYSIDGGAVTYLEKWQPIWISGWNAGKHNVKLELVDKNNAPVDNGGYNSTTREITVIK
ncbi:MAG: hypothetical protein H7Z37_01605 [Pyrinomonadaceae bacterium]|nr:hypothetical protein [Pyrinomonadaceae bacterium]